MTITLTPLDPDTPLRQLPKGPKRALVSGYLAFYIDMVSVYLPLITLAPALIFFRPPGMSPELTSLFFYLTFGAALISRPIGSVYFGYLADKLGRRRITLITVAGFSTVTLITGLLPGYATLGITAYVLLIVMRLFDGFFLGGEYSATTPLAFEACPRNKRGLYGGILETGYSLGYISIAAMTLITLAFLPAGGLDSPYVQWGWRIPFLIGAVMGFVFLLFRSKVPESEVWKSAPKVKSPVRDVLFGPQSKTTYQVLLLTTGFWLSTSTVVSVIPNLLQTNFGIPSATSIGTLIVAQALLAITFVFFGAWAQRVGRRRFIIISTVVMTIVCIPLYFVLAAGAWGNQTLLLVLAVVITVVNGAIWAPLPTYLVERFPTSSRATGYGVGYSVGLVVPGFYSFYMLGLNQFMPFQFTQIPLLFVAAIFIIVGAMLGPETKETSL